MKEIAEQEIRRSSFYERIGLPEVKKRISPTTPYTNVSMEYGLPGMSFNGGLGVLDGDKLLMASRLRIPYLGIGLIYPSRWNQDMRGFTQQENFSNVTPESLGMKYTGVDSELIVNGTRVRLPLFEKLYGTAKLLAPYEPGLRELYYGSINAEHRLYQQSVLGFGALKGAKKIGYEPPILHLNESATAIAGLQDLVDEYEKSKKVGVRNALEFAFSRTREKAIFTNHTLVPAAIGEFPRDKIERYVLPECKYDEIQEFVTNLIDPQRGVLNLSTLAFELAGKINGVSVLHAEIASQSFIDVKGNKVKFEPITNGIDLNRWMEKGLNRFYTKIGILDEFGLPGDQFEEKIDGVPVAVLRTHKNIARRQLLEYLQTQRKDQYGKPTRIFEQAKIVTWAKRLAGYKRPDLPFTNPDKLAGILTAHDMHLVIAGKAHHEDRTMKEEIARLMSLSDNHRDLRDRVHLVLDYDLELGKKLVAGSDVWLNTPILGTEASGTSWMKAIGNSGILISTEDGGVADIKPALYLKIQERDEVGSLYNNLGKAGYILRSDTRWGEHIKQQLKAYLPIISGARMWKDYLSFEFSGK